MSKTTPDATRAFLCRHRTTSSEENYLTSMDYVCLGPPRSCLLFINAVLTGVMLLIFLCAFLIRASG